MTTWRALVEDVDRWWPADHTSKFAPVVDKCRRCSWAGARPQGIGTG